MSEKKNYKSKKAEKLKSKKIEKQESANNKAKRIKQKEEQYNKTKKQAELKKEKEIKELLKPTKQEKKAQRKELKKAKKEEKINKKQIKKYDEMSYKNRIKEQRKNYHPTFSMIVISIFEIIYLIALCVAIGFFVRNTDSIGTIFSAMTAILIFGDIIYLIPRIDSQFKGPTENTFFWHGLGHWISSITINVYYFVVYIMWRGLFSENVAEFKCLEYVICGLLALRVLICLLPQNKWFEDDVDVKWCLIRDIPFAIILGIIAYLFIRIVNISCWGMWKIGISIIVCLICTFITDLGLKKHPKFVWFTLLKSLSYASIVAMQMFMMYNS